MCTILGAPVRLYSGTLIRRDNAFNVDADNFMNTLVESVVVFVDAFDYSPRAPHNKPTRPDGRNACGSESGCPRSLILWYYLWQHQVGGILAVQSTQTVRTHAMPTRSHVVCSYHSPPATPTLDGQWNGVSSFLRRTRVSMFRWYS